MSVTRLKRKKEKRCIVKFKRGLLLKGLLWKPNIKRVDIEEIEKGFVKK